eukprot:NODE_681_length_4794_cov_0.887114.p2 type:complete len:294 gc:universal NODE_681_length_4794_cov_0.887114:1848-2729(+)
MKSKFKIQILCILGIVVMILGEVFKNHPLFLFKSKNTTDVLYDIPFSFIPGLFGFFLGLVSHIKSLTKYKIYHYVIQWISIFSIGFQMIYCYEFFIRALFIDYQTTFVRVLFYGSTMMYCGLTSLPIFIIWGRILSPPEDTIRFLSRSEMILICFYTNLLMDIAHILWDKYKYIELSVTSFMLLICIISFATKNMRFHQISMILFVVQVCIHFVLLLVAILNKTIFYNIPWLYCFPLLIAMPVMIMWAQLLKDLYQDVKDSQYLYNSQDVSNTNLSVTNSKTRLRYSHDYDYI